MPARRRLNQFIFEEACDIAVLADGQEVVTEYRDHADSSMYTAPALELRYRLRYDARIDRVTRAFWAAFGPEFAISTNDTQRLLTKATYVEYFMRLVKALYPSEAAPSAEAARRLACDDWERDGRGQPRLHFAEFKACLFEVADLWTPSLVADDYAHFLKMMYKTGAAPRRDAAFRRLFHGRRGLPRYGDGDGWQSRLCGRCRFEIDSATQDAVIPKSTTGVTCASANDTDGCDTDGAEAHVPVGCGGVVTLT